VRSYLSAARKKGLEAGETSLFRRRKRDFSRVLRLRRLRLAFAQLVVDQVILGEVLDLAVLVLESCRRARIHDFLSEEWLALGRRQHAVTAVVPDDQIGVSAFQLENAVDLPAGNLPIGNAVVNCELDRILMKPGGLLVVAHVDGPGCLNRQIPN
jgi:anti-sigma factor RsiW